MTTPKQESRQDAGEPVAGWASQVLQFWFEELLPSDWFRSNSAVDEAVISRFAGLHEEVSTEKSENLLKNARECLASVIILDQFSRHIYRNSPQAYSFDSKALSLAKKGIECGHDQKVPVTERLFLYLPFEHSEQPDDQQRSVELISGLGVHVYTQCAIAHQHVIERFGRFPERNSFLGRASTADEEAFLSEISALDDGGRAGPLVPDV